jgi:hypothetical protein
MESLSHTREELLAGPGVMPDYLSEWRPTVEWMPHVGMFCMGNVAISLCPWCGSKLPDKSNEAAAAGLKSGVRLHIGPDGMVRAEVAGEVVDGAALVASWKAELKDRTNAAIDRPPDATV